MLDTHALIWSTTSEERLSAGVRSALSDIENEIFVSAATAWELAIKCALGKLRYPVERYTAILERAGFISLAVKAHHGLAAAALPRHHNDPFDRMLIAQARIERLVLVTADRECARYDVELLL